MLIVFSWFCYLFLEDDEDEDDEYNNNNQEGCKLLLVLFLLQSVCLLCSVDVYGDGSTLVEDI